MKVNEAAKRVDVTIDGKPFTSYIWPSHAEEAGALPASHREGHARHARLSAGSAPGERVDHPHHVGMWLNHGDVNGLDFWNNSDAIAAGAGAEDGHDPSPPDRRHQERRDRRAS